MQKNIDQVLTENSFAVRQLLRRSRIIGEPNMESIQKGFEKHGEPFMLKLLDIITPSEASFTELLAPKSGLLQSSVDTKTLATAATAKPAESGKFWSFWDKLLNGVNSTGETLGKFKKDVTGTAPETELSAAEVAKQKNNSNLLYMVAAGFVFLIVIILIIRK